MDVLERDLAVTQWEPSACIPVPSMGPEFDSGTLCALRSRSNRSTGPEVYAMSDEGQENESTASDTDSLACEPRIRRRRLSLVWESNQQTANNFREQESVDERPVPAGRRSFLVPQVDDSTSRSLKLRSFQDGFSPSLAIVQAGALREAASHPGADHRARDASSSKSDTENLGDGQSEFDGDAEVVSTEPEPVREAVRARVSPAIRAGFRSFDHVDVAHLFD